MDRRSPHGRPGESNLENQNNGDIHGLVGAFVSQLADVHSPQLATDDCRRTLPVRAYWLIFAIALLTRASWGIYRHSHHPGLEFPDEEQYWLIASNLANGEGLKDELGFRAGRMPLYPAFLSFFTTCKQGILLARCAHWVLGAFVATAAAHLASSIFSRRESMVAGLLVAFDPFLIFFSSLLLTETPFAHIFTLFLWMAVSFVTHATSSNSMIKWLITIALAITSIYLRESSLIVICVAMCLLPILRGFIRRLVIGSLVAIVIVIASLIPWAARNNTVLGDWAWLTTRGGISLYDGVRPDADGGSDLGHIKDAPIVRPLRELERDAYFRREAWQLTKKDPLRIAGLAVQKWVRMWNPVPNAETYRSRFVQLVASLWSVPVFTLAVVGGILCLKGNFRTHGRWLIFLLWPIVAFTAIHGVFVGSLRYRMPLMPILEVLAACAAVRGWDWLKRRQPSRFPRDAIESQ